MGKLKYLSQKPPDGKMYYIIVYVYGYMLTVMLDIDLIKESWFSVRLFIGGMITAGGARFFNRVLIPKYQKWKLKRRRKTPKPPQ